MTTFTKKALYQMYNINKPFRKLVLDKLQTGLKGYNFKDSDKEIDLRHIDILSNWKHKTKQERMSFINDINLTEEIRDEGLSIVLNKKEEFKEHIKDKTKRTKTSIRKFFRGDK